MGSAFPFSFIYNRGMENYNSVLLDENQRVGSKFIARVFGYLFIGLGITAVIAFLFPVIAQRNSAWYVDGQLTNAGASMILGVGIVSLIVLFIDMFVMAFWGRKSGKAPWIPYIIYAAAMGFALSLYLLLGVSYSLMGEAFGLSALVFGIMGLIGYFSKSNMNGFAFVGLTLVIMLLIYSLFFFIQYLFLLGTNQWEAYQQAFIYNIVAGIIILVVTMIVTVIDVNNMRKMANQGITNNNMALLCAYNLYSDFIMILIRILYLLALAKKDS